MSLSDAQVKASAVLARMRFAREKHGPVGEERLRAALRPAYRDLVDGVLLPQQWVPFGLFVAANVEADKLFGRGDLALCYEMGRFGADVNLPTLYKLFYKLGTPTFIMSRAAKLWSLHYDSGALTSTIVGERTLRLAIENFARPHRAHCLSVLGWAARSAELSGAKKVVATERSCRTSGAPRCELSIEWC
jgi:hypothetical protein